MGPMSAGELGERAGLTTGAITGILDRLEKAGWAKRTADPMDRRKIIVQPGPQDSSTMAELYEGYIKSLMSVLEQYTDAELTLIWEFIDKLTEINQEQAR
jgi:DNA-binding MarR family transcriptional regulator